MARKVFDRCIRCQRWTLFGTRKFYRCPSCNLPFCSSCVDKSGIFGLAGYDCPHCKAHLPRRRLEEFIDHEK